MIKNRLQSSYAKGTTITQKSNHNLHRGAIDKVHILDLECVRETMSSPTTCHWDKDMLKPMKPSVVDVWNLQTCIKHQRNIYEIYTS